jgi:hypothetical protein
MERKGSQLGMGLSVTRSFEKGSGSWTASAGLVNMTWRDSSTVESWTRPITVTSTRAFYRSSYFTGIYPVEKADAKLILAKPPEVYQTALYCWAAGASSWRRVKQCGNESVDDLKVRFGGYLNDDGSLPEGDANSPDAQKGGMKEVFSQLGIRIENIAVSAFTYDYVQRMLKANGHFLLMAGHGTDMGHTYVVYGVGDPSPEYFSVFDPLIKGNGYQNKKFSDVGGTRAYVGFGK